MKNSSLWGVGKLDSEFILKTSKWPWGPCFPTVAALRQPDSTSASYQTDSAGLNPSVRSAYKKSIMGRFYPFGLSQVGREMNGHQQKAINLEVIYDWALLDRRSRSSAEMYQLLVLRLLFRLPGFHVCSGADCTPTPAGIHPGVQEPGCFLVPSLTPAAWKLTTFIEHIYTRLHFWGVFEFQLGCSETW